MGQRNAIGTAWGFVQIQPQRRPHRQLHRAVFHTANPEFGSLQIGQDTDGPADHPFQISDNIESPCVIGMVTMAEIQTKDIRARFEQRTDHLGRIARWAERRNDLGLAETAHTRLIDQALRRCQR